MVLFAEILPGMSPHYIGLPVVDLTELSGRYDFNLSWEPQQLQERAGDGGINRSYYFRGT